MKKEKLRILLVTSDRERCGITEYGNYLGEEMEKYQDLEFTQFRNPNSFELGAPEVDVIHVNHHAGLHSNWTEERVKEYQKHGYAVVVTQHDSFEKFSIMLERGFPDFRCADGLVVHEPVEGLTDCGLEGVQWLHQGVLPGGPEEERGKGFEWKSLGTVGFDFPWKNFDLIARLCEKAGWKFVLVSPGMPEERQREVKELNGNTEIHTDWKEGKEVVKVLEKCHATAFLYNTGNSGTSGAIRIGMAARRPVIAFPSRQNRDLWKGNPKDSAPFFWVDGDENTLLVLRVLGIQGAIPRDFGLEAAADEYSWERLAERYRKIYWQAWEKRN